ncbi:MAG: hypothetical protein M3Y85_02830, partial [Bacteroidota bacterium]|nr:hypothetical protein [Bacteroidota bacterium]
MRKIVFSALVLCFSFSAFAQNDTASPRRIMGPMETRAKDHFLIQVGGASWQNRPDSIKISGFSRTFNFYLMWDFPFKTSPKLSVALG